jgi:hypothetical protein
VRPTVHHHRDEVEAFGMCAALEAVEPPSLVPPQAPVDTTGDAHGTDRESIGFNPSAAPKLRNPGDVQDVHV